MRAIFVDDEYYQLSHLVHECEQIEGLKIVGVFDNHEDALACAAHDAIDMALLDIEMPIMDGVTLAERLRRIYPDLVVVYVTAHYETEVDIGHDGRTFVLTKPFRRRDVEDVLARIART